MIVNLWDSRGLDPSWPNTAPRHGIIRIVAGSNEPIRNVFRRVVYGCGKRRHSIWLLRFLAHGNSGIIELGRENLTSATADSLNMLRDYFSPNAIGIAIHSCGPASHTDLCRRNWINHLLWGNCGTIVPGTVDVGGGRGINFLRAMSRAANTNVRGGLNMQRPEYSSFRFEGPTVTVTPNGQFYITDNQRQSRDTTRIVRSRQFRIDL